MKHGINWVLKGYFATHFIHKEMQDQKISLIFKMDIHQILRIYRSRMGQTLPPFACYCYNIFPGSNGTESQFFLMFG